MKAESLYLYYLLLLFSFQELLDYLVIHSKSQVDIFQWDFFFFLSRFEDKEAALLFICLFL